MKTSELPAKYTKEKRKTRFDFLFFRFSFRDVRVFRGRVFPLFKQLLSPAVA
jgi:hypothetical protein